MSLSGIPYHPSEFRTRCARWCIFEKWILARVVKWGVHNNDSSVVVGQILGHNMAKEYHMAAYLTKAKTEAQKFRNVIFIKVPRAQNNKADRLAKLASST